MKLSPFILLVFILISPLAMLTNCSKEMTLSQSHDLNQKSKLLLGKGWEEVSIRVIGTSSQEDITNQFMKSDLDDIIVFYADGYYHFDEGPTKARHESKQIYQKGKWELSENDRLIFYDMNNLSTVYDIVALSKDSLVISYPIENKDYTYLMTYKPLP